MLILHCFLASLATISGKNITTDQSALLMFKAHVIDFQNVLTNNWSISYPVCSWVGISCGSRHHRVSALNLSYMGLQGTIPPHLGNLSFLVYLDMGNNSFHDHLPNELGNYAGSYSLVSVTINWVEVFHHGSVSYPNSKVWIFVITVLQVPYLRVSTTFPPWNGLI